jgi:UDP-MurNAc hydroxylase
MNTSIEFINHACVIIKSDKITLLSDPWFEGDAFHKGWSLLYETNELEVEKIINKITHIWISHEHPDHFSILFFKKFKLKIINQSIKILFQETKDKRVINFLKNQGFDCEELKLNKKIYLNKTFSLTCIKDGFYDSGLLVISNNEKILNLNDCEINSQSRINEVNSITGNVDVLLTQFSFAAWKGGKDNKKWRTEAAKEKIETMKKQIEGFKPKFVIPFASFIYFSNIENNYLNDSINKPQTVLDELKNLKSEIIVMKPNDILGGKNQKISNSESLNFWQTKYNLLNNKKFNSFEKITYDEIFDNFQIYCQRIKKKNNFWLMRTIRMISPISVFKPVIIELSDLNINVEFDYLNKKFLLTDKTPQLSMKSESLNFLFKNNFGFDTLTVNGCFEEKKNDGFASSTKTLAIENLNNLGIYISFKTLLNFTIIKLFLNRLYRVTKKLKSQ